MTNANTIQVGGNHYQRGADNQHWDWVTINKLSYLHGCATKYICRWRVKDGVQDLDKAIHFINKAQEMMDAGHLVPPAGNEMEIPLGVFCEENGVPNPERRIMDMFMFGGHDATARAIEGIFMLKMAASIFTDQPELGARASNEVRAMQTQIENRICRFLDGVDG